MIAISKEGCLSVYIYALVVILRQKTGNFLDYFST